MAESEFGREGGYAGELIADMLYAEDDFCGGEGVGGSILNIDEGMFRKLRLFTLHDTRDNLIR